MKKLFLFAATAMMFAACSNEEVSTPQLAQETADDGGVRFEVYVPGSTAQTRGGRINVMTNNTLKKSGFGVYAYQHNNTVWSAETKPVPDYMWNQQVFFDGSSSAWYYAPLKYWPNETKNDSQKDPAEMPDVTTPLNVDRVSFFAYAPWVLGVKGTDGEGYTASYVYGDIENKTDGIKEITSPKGYTSLYKDTEGYPRVKYVIAQNPDESVDLLWGVAPAGGLNYKAVDNQDVTIPEGMPLIDLKKPAVNTNLKFMFQHALARIGVKVVLAADQVASGGYFDFGNTKVTVEEIAIKGDFGKSGYLRLDNSDKNMALWEDITKCNSDGTALKLNKDNGLAEHLIYDSEKNTALKHQQQTVTGVTTTVADAIKVSTIDDSKYQTVTTESDYAYLVTSPSYLPTTPYFKELYEHATTADCAAYSTNFSSATEKYFYLNPTTGAYTETTLSVTYPTASVLDNLYYLTDADNNFKMVLGSDVTAGTYKNKTAYRKVGNVYTPTGQTPDAGEWVFTGTTAYPVKYTSANLGTVTPKLYRAIPNYFMVIPTQTSTSTTNTPEDITVKITYYVSTKDASLADGIVYTKNEVEKTITLPHLKNGVSYDLKLILGMTSVKVEAEVADWTTTGAEINLPQNTAE